MRKCCEEYQWQQSSERGHCRKCGKEKVAVEDVSCSGCHTIEDAAAKTVGVPNIVQTRSGHVVKSIFSDCYQCFVEFLS